MPTKKQTTRRILQASEETPSSYRIELRIGDSVVESEAPSMLEALQKLEKPTKIITKGTIKVFHGDNNRELFFMPVQMKRLFYPLAQVTVAKMLAMNL